MASITIRKLDDALKSRLRVRAAEHGRSMEEEAREILRAGLRVQRKEPRNLYEMVRQYVDPIGGVDLELPPRGPMREPPSFDE